VETKSRAISTARPDPGRGLPSRIYRFFREWPVIPMIILVVLVTCAIFAPLLAPHNERYGDLRAPNIPPAWLEGGTSKYILGTDTLGRDLLSRMIFGARISLVVAATVLSTGAIGGTAIGLIAGYFGGQVDELLMRFVDFTLAIPFILIALAVIIVFGQSLTIIIVLLAVVSWGGFARQIRAEALTIRTLDYIALAKVAGAGSSRIMYRHVLPGVVNTIIIIATLRVGTLILTESILSFLGVGVPPPTPAWGTMVSDGRDYLDSAWWIAVFPGMAIFLTVLAFNFLGDWLRDRLDPRLRQL
jgi:peptide/nickel transport system permease protein